MTYRKFIPMVLLRVTPIALLMAILIDLYAYRAQAQLAPVPTKLSVDDPRPLAKAIEELVSRCGYVITYEDPRHVYEGDLQDVTTQVRNDLNHYSPGNAPKVIVPRGGTLTLTLPSSTSLSTQNVASILDQLIRAQANRGEGGHFRVVEVGDVFNVIPIEVRDRNGNWVAQSSILDAPISLPLEDRDEAEMFGAIVQAVSVAAHVKVQFGGGIGGGLSNPDRPRPYRFGARNEVASDVLMRALILLNDPKNGRWRPRRLTWQLLYDNSDNGYFLNISSVPDRQAFASPVATSVPKTSPVSTVSGTSAPQKK